MHENGDKRNNAAVFQPTINNPRASAVGMMPSRSSSVCRWGLTSHPTAASNRPPARMILVLVSMTRHKQNQCMDHGPWSTLRVQLLYYTRKRGWSKQRSRVGISHIHVIFLDQRNHPTCPPNRLLTLTSTLLQYLIFGVFATYINSIIKVDRLQARMLCCGPRVTLLHIETLRRQ